MPVVVTLVAEIDGGYAVGIVPVDQQVNLKNLAKAVGSKKAVMAKPDVVGQCGCGRSPTGKCIGWHGLSEDEYKKNLEEFRRQEQSSNTAG